LSIALKIAEMASRSVSLISARQMSNRRMMRSLALGFFAVRELVGAVEQRLDVRRLRRRAHAASASRSPSKRACAAWIFSTFSIAQVARPQIGFCSDWPSSVSA
jgi:hypothetical protein